MKHPKTHAQTLGLALAAAALLTGGAAHAQMYSWKDPDSGRSKLSNIPPPWYNRGASASGPRVITTRGGKVIDDTALPYRDRLALAGNSRDQIESSPLQKTPQTGPPQDRGAPSARPDAQVAGRPPADTAPTRNGVAAKKGS